MGCGGGVMVLLTCSDRMHFSIVSWDIGYLIPSAVLIWSLAVAPDAPIARLLATRPFVYGGTISFALYLFHQPLIHYANITATSLTRWAIHVTALVVVTVLVAAAAHHWIESPAQRWLRTRMSTAAPHRQSAEATRQAGQGRRPPIRSGGGKAPVAARPQHHSHPQSLRNRNQAEGLSTEGESSVDSSIQ